MIEQSKVNLTADKLAIEGVQVTFKVVVGDWTRTVAISPIDYEVFKKWDDIYAKMVVDNITKQIDWEIGRD